MEPPPEFDPDVGGAYSKERDFHRDIPPVEWCALLHSLRQRLYQAAKLLHLRTRKEVLEVIPACEAIGLDTDPDQRRQARKESPQKVHNRPGLVAHEHGNDEIVHEYPQDVQPYRPPIDAFRRHARPK